MSEMSKETNKLNDDMEAVEGTSAAIDEMLEVAPNDEPGGSGDVNHNSDKWNTWRAKNGNEDKECGPSRMSAVSTPRKKRAAAEMENVQVQDLSMEVTPSDTHREGGMEALQQHDHSYSKRMKKEHSALSSEEEDEVEADGTRSEEEELSIQYEDSDGFGDDFWLISSLSFHDYCTDESEDEEGPCKKRKIEKEIEVSAESSTAEKTNEGPPGTVEKGGRVSRLEGETSAISEFQ